MTFLNITNNKMSRERLIFKGVSEIVGTENLGLLILTDEASQRQITVVCDKAMAVQVELRLKKVEVSSIMLPEVMCRVLDSVGKQRFELSIEDIVDGQYRTMLHDAYTLESHLIRTSDAVLLSIVGKIPIYIDSKLMRRQSVPYDKYARGVSLPINTISDEMLRAALDKAVADENYELASHLHDEQKRREGNKDTASKN